MTSTSPTRRSESTRQRFVAKRMPGGKRGSDWRVYDVQRGSYPYTVPDLGTVLQDASQAEIEAECQRLFAEHGGVDVRQRGRAARQGPTSGSDEPEAGLEAAQEEEGETDGDD